MEEGAKGEGESSGEGKQGGGGGGGGQREVQCCQLAFFYARFHKFGIENFEIYLLFGFFYRNSYLLFGIGNFEIC